MIEAFIEFIDGIYWTGYASQLAKDDPEKFNFEYLEFIDNYS